MKIFKKIVIIILVLAIAVIYSYGLWPRAIYDTSVGSSAYEVTNALEKNSIFEQSFMSLSNGLCGISIKLTKQTNKSIGSYEWIVVEEKTGKHVGEGTIDDSSTKTKDFESKTAQKQGNVKLGFNKQNNSKGMRYLLTITPKSISKNETIAVYITKKGNVDSTLNVQGEQLNKASVVKLQYQRFNVETFIVFLGIALYLMIFVKFMYKLFR